MAVCVTFTILTLLLLNKHQRLQLQAQEFITFQHLQHAESIAWHPVLAYNNLFYSTSLQIKKDRRIKWDRDQSRIRKTPYFYHIDLVNACRIENKQKQLLSLKDIKALVFF